MGELRRPVPWESLGQSAQAFAFESIFDASNPQPGGCLSDPGPVEIQLIGGTVVFELDSGVCPIQDRTSIEAAADAYIAEGDTLTLTFDPPITSFLTYAASVAIGEIVTLQVLSDDGTVDYTMQTDISTNNVLGIPQGFHSRKPIRQIRLMTTEAGTSVIGEFVGLPSSGNQALEDAGFDCGPHQCDFAYAYETGLPPGFLTSASSRVGLAAITIDGDTMAMSVAGGINLHERNEGGPDNWGFVKTIPSPAADIAFGGDSGNIALSGDTLVVGAPLFNAFFDNSGRVYIYERNLGGTNNWGLQRFIANPLSIGNDIFGASVSLDGDLLAVGASGSGTSIRTGLAYLFERNLGGVNNWGERVRREPPGLSFFDVDFGFSVAVHGDTWVVGAPDASFVDDQFQPVGRAYVYARNEGGTNVWGLADDLIGNGFIGSRFGESVAVRDGTIAIGSPRFSPPKPVGASYWFEQALPFNTWPLEGRIEYPEQVLNIQLGELVSIAGGQIYTLSTRTTSGPFVPGRLLRTPLKAPDDQVMESVFVVDANGNGLISSGSLLASDGQTVIVGAEFAGVRGIQFLPFDAAFTDRFENED